MFYRNLLLAVGVLSLVIAIVARFTTGMDILAVSPAFLFWYLMGVGTLMVVGAALADLWTRNAVTLRSIEGEVRHLTQALQQAAGANRETAATTENLEETPTAVADGD